MAVILPNLDPKRELARKLIESAISQIPIVGGPYVAMLSVTHKSDAEAKIAAWREEITKSINNLEKAINDVVPTIKLSNNASALGLWFSQMSPLGRPDSVDFDAIRGAFPNATKLELEDACGELELEGLVVASGAIGHKIRLVRPANRLFEVFDPIAIEGSNPRIDAACLAQFVLENHEGVSGETMRANFGWAVRRLNPAISILCGMISNGGQSAEVHPEFECDYIRPNSADRAMLKRYIEATFGAQ